MIITMNCITVAPDRAEDFERAFLERERLLGQAPGFLGFEFLRRDRDSEYVVLTRWRSDEDFEAWVRSDLFRRVHRRDRNTDFGGHSELRRYAVLDSEEAPVAV